MNLVVCQHAFLNRFTFTTDTCFGQLPGYGAVGVTFQIGSRNGEGNPLQICPKAVLSLLSFSDWTRKLEGDFNRFVPAFNSGLCVEKSRVRERSGYEDGVGGEAARGLRHGRFNAGSS